MIKIPQYIKNISCAKWRFFQSFVLLISKRHHRRFSFLLRFQNSSGNMHARGSQGSSHIALASEVLTSRLGPLRKTNTLAFLILLSWQLCLSYFFKGKPSATSSFHVRIERLRTMIHTSSHPYPHTCSFFNRESFPWQPSESLPQLLLLTRSLMFPNNKTLFQDLNCFYFTNFFPQILSPYGQKWWLSSLPSTAVLPMPDNSSQNMFAKWRDEI